MRFSYGNTYARVNDPSPAFPEDSSCMLKLEHSWVMFVILTEDRSKTEGYIKSVTYHIPRIDKDGGEPLYKDEREKISITSSPFVLSRESCLPCYIEIDIVFHEWTQVDTQRVVYQLKFSGRGDHQPLLVPIDTYKAADHIQFCITDNLNKEQLIANMPSNMSKNPDEKQISFTNLDDNYLR